METFSDSAALLLSHEGEADQIDYVNGTLTGKCLPFLSELDIHALPWDSAPRSPVTDGIQSDAVLCVKRSTSRCVLTFVVEGPGATPMRVYAKRCIARRGLKRLVSWTHKSKSQREWQLGWALLNLGIPTALPLLWADRRREGILIESFFVTLGLEDTVSFDALWRKLPQAEDRALCLRQLGAFLRACHEKGFAHDDLSAEHVLVDSEALRSAGSLLSAFRFIDLDQSRLTPRPTQPYRRAHNFYQIFRSLPADLLGQAERRAFYEGYSGGLWKSEQIAAFERAIEFIAFQKKINWFFKPTKWFKKR